MSEVTSLNAVTLATRDMARAVAFYRALGFRLKYGGGKSPFTSFHAGPCHLNLFRAESEWSGLWGRAIFYVDDVDAFHAQAVDAGIEPDFAPRDAPWGERYFHVTDPDGHEVSFAKPLD